jgi:hypothetical protein
MFWFYFSLALVGVFALAGGVGGVLAGASEGSKPLAAGFGLFGLFAGVLFGGLIAIIPMTYAQTHYNERSVEVKVLDKDRTGDGDMRVYTDKGVFVNADSFWRGKHNSADWWAKWEEGKTYRFDVAGWRLGVTSDFPNIFAWEGIK